MEANMEATEGSIYGFIHKLMCRQSQKNLRPDDNKRGLGLVNPNPYDVVKKKSQIFNHGILWISGC